ncbi:hypothetical protein ACFVHI_24375, partial [Kitasatospora sp. NPDC127121]
ARQAREGSDTSQADGDGVKKPGDGEKEPLPDPGYSSQAEAFRQLREQGEKDRAAAAEAARKAKEASGPPKADEEAPKEPGGDGEKEPLPDPAYVTQAELHRQQREQGEADRKAKALADPSFVEREEAKALADAKRPRSTRELKFRTIDDLNAKKESDGSGAAAPDSGSDGRPEGGPGPVGSGVQDRGRSEGSQTQVEPAPADSEGPGGGEQQGPDRKSGVHGFGDLKDSGKGKAPAEKFPGQGHLLTDDAPPVPPKDGAEGSGGGEKQSPDRKSGVHGLGDLKDSGKGKAPAEKFPGQGRTVDGPPSVPPKDGVVEGSGGGAGTVPPDRKTGVHGLGDVKDSGKGKAPAEKFPGQGRTVDGPPSVPPKDG